VCELRPQWSGVEWSGVEWSGVEWSGVEWSAARMQPALPSQAPLVGSPCQYTMPLCVLELTVRPLTAAFLPCYLGDQL